jgi:hypothetical protein
MRPLFYSLTRLQTRLALRKEGYGFFEINGILDGAEDEVIDAALVASGGVPVALGDGSILKAIMDFLKSEQGQALIKILLGLLVGLA